MKQSLRTLKNNQPVYYRHKHHIYSVYVYCVRVRVRVHVRVCECVDNDDGVDCFYALDLLSTEGDRTEDRGQRTEE